MVSFSCENCGDVLTKKKLDQHYNRCYGQFTCIDCMTTFSGTSFRSHTSCISEDQKYQGALYKEKAPKKKSVHIVEPGDKRSKQPYIEDAPDQDDGPSTAVALVNAPPEAPSPPPSAALIKPNVFDFLVNDETPNASRTSLAEPMQMVAHAPPVFRSHSNSPPSSSHGDEHRLVGHDKSNGSNNVVYGTGLIPAAADADLYRTPAPRESRRRRDSPSRYAPEVVTSATRKSTDKKRKRQVEELDLTQAQQYKDGAPMELDDAHQGSATLHSGLTGGLSRMLSKSDRDQFPPTVNGNDGQEHDSDYTDVEETPLNEAQSRRERHRERDRDRERRSRDTKEKDREGRRGRSSAAEGHVVTSGPLIKVRKGRRTSDESRPRKHHRSHRHRSDEHPDRERTRRPSGEGGSRRRGSKTKAIEWKANSDDEYEDVGAADDAETGDGQMVLYKNGGQRRASSSARHRNRAEWFLSFITKGPDSERGYSMNKALKRYHRERMGGGEGGSSSGRRDDRDRDRIEDEKELWKGLRLRRNDRGEIVLFMLDGDE